MDTSLDTLIHQILAHDSSVTDLHIREGIEPWLRNKEGLQVANADAVSRPSLLGWLEMVHYKGQDVIDRLRQEGGDDDFSVSVGAHRLRVNVYLSKGLVSLALRRLNDKNVHFTQLGLPESVLKLADRPKGLFLVVGGTGSGKSTTLAAIVNHLNETRQGHIITLEDPIEYIIRSKRSMVSQRSIGGGQGQDSCSFAQALRAALREDPDVILIGELRDKASMEIALAAAETGHLVLGTLHTNSAYQTIDRIAGFFSNEKQGDALSVLASVINGIVAQTMLRDREGQVVIAPEVMVPNSAIRHYIREGNASGIRQEMETGSREGQLLLNQSLANLVRAGRIPADEARYHSLDVKALETLL